MKRPLIDDSRKIVKIETLTLYGRRYRDITFEDGEQILLRKDKKSKMYIILRFTQEDDKEVIEKLKEITKAAFFGNLKWRRTKTAFRGVKI